MKRMFGITELVFNICYLLSALVMGIILLATAGGSTVKVLAGCMALVLSMGDAFHLIPRILIIISGKESNLRYALGVGKQVASITMTMFYILLWHIGILLLDIKYVELWSIMLYIFAVIRIAICLLPNNKWSEHYPPISWGILRNIPFFIMGMGIAVVFFVYRINLSSLQFVWLAIIASYVFYMPVVLWSNKNAKIGMLMLPKSLAYISMLIMCLYL